MIRQLKPDGGRHCLYLSLDSEPVLDCQADDCLDVAALPEVVAGPRGSVDALGDQLQPRNMPRESINVGPGRAAGQV